MQHSRTHKPSAQSHHSSQPFFAKGSRSQEAEPFFAKPSSTPAAIAQLQREVGESEELEEVQAKAVDSDLESPQLANDELPLPPTEPPPLAEANRNSIIQTKLTIGQPNDRYEQEADQVAEQVMRMPGPMVQRQLEADAKGNSPELVQRKCDTCEQQEKAEPKMIQPKLQVGQPNDQYEQEADRVAEQVVRHSQAAISSSIQTKAESNSPRITPLMARQGNGSAKINPQVEHSIQQSSNSGQSIAQPVKTSMEQAFRADFSDVKVHTDNNADQLNRSFSARAFTTGQNIYFKQGEYQPNGQAGQKLLAHELTHVMQQNQKLSSGFIQKDEDDEIFESVGIDSRSFEEVWDQFSRARTGIALIGEDNSAALTLVPTLLAKMELDDAIDHAGELGLWLAEQGVWELANQTFSRLESALWVTYAVGAEIPRNQFSTLGFGPATALDLIEQAEQIIENEHNHQQAISIFTLAHLLLQIQLIQFPQNQSEETLTAERVFEINREEMLELRQRIINYYPYQAFLALQEGNSERAEQLTQQAETLRQEIQERSIEISDLEPEQSSESAASLRSRPLSSPRTDGHSVEEIPETVEESEQTSGEEGETRRPRAEQVIHEQPAPFNGALVLAAGLNYYHVGSSIHAITGSLGAAVTMARNLFGVSGAVIAERLGSQTEIAFAVAGITPNYSLQDFRTQPVEGEPGLVGIRGATVFLELGNNRDYLVRALLTADDEAFFAVPGGELLPGINQRALLEQFHTEITSDQREGRSTVSSALIQSELFGPIDDLLSSESGDDHSRGLDRLTTLDATAYAAIEWRDKSRYLELLIDAWQSQERRRAIIEIIKSVESRSRLDTIVERLRSEGIWEDIVRRLDGQIWSLLAVVGQKFGNPEPLSVERVTTILLEARLLEPVPGIAIGPDGPEISVDALAELESAADTFVDFLGNSLDSIVMLITEPDKIVQGVAQLVKLMVTWKLAELGHVDSIQERNQMLQAVGQQIIYALQGLEILADLSRSIIRQVKWALIWEIASMFIGVGEIRAVLGGLELGRATAVATRLLRVLGLGGRLAESQQLVTKLTGLTRIMSRASRVLGGEDDVMRLLAHLPDNTTRRLGQAMQRADFDDTLDLARLASRHPELGEITQVVLREIEVLQELAQKAGQLSDDMVRAFRQLRGRGLSLDTISDVVRVIPEGEGARFASALRLLEGAGPVGADEFASIAGNINRMNAVRQFGATTYLRAYATHVDPASPNDLRTLDRFLEGLEQRRARLPAEQFQRELDDLLPESAAIRRGTPVTPEVRQLQAGRQWAADVLRLPRDLISDLSAAAIEQLRQLGASLRNRLSRLSDALKRVCLSCTSPCLDDPGDLDFLVGFLRSADVETASAEALEAIRPFFGRPVSEGLPSGYHLRNLDGVQVIVKPRHRPDLPGLQIVDGRIEFRPRSVRPTPISTSRLPEETLDDIEALREGLFARAAERRAALGPLSARSGPDFGTYAMLEIEGVDSVFDGVSGTARRALGREIPITLSPNRRTLRHAEAEAFQRARDSGASLSGRSGRLVVDRNLCRFCEWMSGVRGLAGELGLARLEIHTPGGVMVLRAGVDF